jgi:hypothetical protein
LGRRGTQILRTSKRWTPEEEYHLVTNSFSAPICKDGYSCKFKEGTKDAEQLRDRR